MELSLVEHTGGETRGLPPEISGKYRLKAIVSHLGTTAYSGHYVADICDHNGKWKIYDDSVVKEVEKKNFYFIIFNFFFFRNQLKQL
jgi:ubiquitin C-terminal hydrolase